jgi:hypothetical protein
MMLLTFPSIIVLGLVLQSSNNLTLTQRLSRHLAASSSSSLPGFLHRGATVSLEKTIDVGGMNWPTGNQLIMTVDVPRPTSELWRSTAFDRYDQGRWLMSYAPTSSLVNTGLEPGIKTALAEGALPRLTTSTIRALLTGASSTGFVSSTYLPQRVEIHAMTDSDTSPIYGAFQIYRFQTTLGLHPIYDADGGLSITSASLPEEEMPIYFVLSIIKPEPDRLHLKTTLSLDTHTKLADLQIPDALRARFRAQALAILSEAKLTNTSDPYTIVKQFEIYLGQHYQYTLTPSAPKNGEDPLLDFLFHQHAGYCVYFSGAMVMLCRSIGLPARMAVGFATGDIDPLSSQPDAAHVTYRVTADQAHAWVEVFLPHYGWYTADPTAGSTVASTFWGKSWDVLSEDLTVIKTSMQQVAHLLRTQRTTQYVLLLCALALVAGVLTHRFWQRRRLPALPRSEISTEEAAAAVIAAYGHLSRWLRLRGAPKQRGYTALEFLTTLRRGESEMTPLVEELSRLYIRARYSNHPLYDRDARRAWILLKLLR